MNEIKINMVKFLMTMFETNLESINNVEYFKADVEELVRRHQISPVTRDIVYNMYGIMNTNVFKPKLQEEKLMQIEMMMRLGERIRSTGNVTNFTKFKENVEQGLRQGTISKSARDIIFEIYDLDSIGGKTNTKPTVSKIPSLEPVLDVKPVVNGTNNNLNNKTEDKSKKSKDVLADISKFKSQYVSEIYYEYANPHFDGCTGSKPYLYVKLINALQRPAPIDKIRFVYSKEVYNDGCHSRFSYIEIPKEWYKPTNSVNTPANSGFCSSNGNRRYC